MPVPHCDVADGGASCAPVFVSTDLQTCIDNVTATCEYASGFFRNVSSSAPPQNYRAVRVQGWGGWLAIGSIWLISIGLSLQVRAPRTKPRSAHVKPRRNAHARRGAHQGGHAWWAWRKREGTRGRWWSRTRALFAVVHARVARGRCACAFAEARTQARDGQGGAHVHGARLAHRRHLHARRRAGQPARVRRPHDADGRDRRRRLGGRRGQPDHLVALPRRAGARARPDGRRLHPRRRLLRLRLLAHQPGAAHGRLAAAADGLARRGGDLRLVRRADPDAGVRGAAHRPYLHVLVPAALVGHRLVHRGRLEAGGHLPRPHDGRHGRGHPLHQAAPRDDDRIRVHRVQRLRRRRRLEARQPRRHRVDPRVQPVGARRLRLLL